MENQKNSVQSANGDLSKKRKISDDSGVNKRGKVENNPKVHLTVSSLDNTSIPRRLELNWYNVPEKLAEDENSWVGLFTHDPCKGIDDPLARADVKKYPGGYFRTNVGFPKLQFKENKLSDDCLPFWIAFIQNKTVLATSCMRPRPRWMEQLRNEIGNKKLNEIMIPGTHDSGSYRYTTTPICGNSFVRTQEEDIWTQLVYGIRYLDIRVKCMDKIISPHNMWIMHGICKIDLPLIDVLRQVKKFMKATNEIVFLDFHEVRTRTIELYIFERHQMLVSLLTKELGEFMLPDMKGSLKTFNELWESGKRLFVGYAYDNRSDLSPLLNKQVQHLWANTTDVKILEDYLQNSISKPQTYLYSAMAELTLGFEGIVFGSRLREMAQEVNSNVTQWFRDRWSQCANIVASDFFLGNDIINVAIETNKKRD